MTRLYPVSPTKLGVWLDCPYRFFLQYVEKRPSKGVWAHLSLGNSIHAVLRDWFDRPIDKRTKPDLASAMGAAWIDVGYRDGEQSEQWRGRATHMVGEYLDTVDPQFTPFSTERSLGARSDVVTITGRIDRLDERAEPSEQLVVVDYKTGRQPSSEDEARSSLALAAYVACVRQSLRRPCSRVELHHIPTATRAVWEHTEESLGRQLDRIDRIGREMSGAEQSWAEGHGDLATLFPANPSRVCGWCDFRSECAEGQQASSPLDAWAGLPAD